MFQLIERLRQKPARERRAIAVGTAGAITGIIFIIWAVSFVALLDRTPRADTQSGNFDSFFDSFGEATKSVQESIGTVREQVKGLNTDLQELEKNQSVSSDSETTVIGEAETEGLESVISTPKDL